jgi:DNA-binding MarR family transcriptional regulator
MTRTKTTAPSGINEPELLSTMAVRLVRAQGLILANLDESLTFRQYVTLLRIHGGLRSIVGLAGEARLTLPTVSQSVDSLVKRGLITRGQDKADRRLTVLSLTAAGVAAMRAAKRRLEEALTECLDGIDAGVRQSLLDSFVTIGDWATAQLDAAYGAAT